MAKKRKCPHYTDRKEGRWIKMVCTLPAGKPCRTRVARQTLTTRRRTRMTMSEAAADGRTPRTRSKGAEYDQAHYSHGTRSHVASMARYKEDLRNRPR